MTLAISTSDVAESNDWIHEVCFGEPAPSCRNDRLTES